MARKRHLTEEPPADPLYGSEDAVEANGAGPENGDQARIEQLEAELAEAKDRYLRAIAEMENVRRRARQEAETERKFANERLITELLPVMDNFIRALEAAEQTENLEALKNGVDQIQRLFAEVLERAGLERIDALGQPFDPNLHEAIMQVEPRDGQEPHQVVDELRAGYRLADRVLRPTLVKVTSG